ncbi:uncharacterized protein LOC111059253, partial [Nilaparvata lugens]|uniref:uncharacterized protein LOC111059253 n=1 Tax=Nilaparvata lugens TaxID=108931 RepID=UPI00193CDE92
YPSKKQGLTWKDETPYFTFGYRDYHCHHGKDTNLSSKKAYSEKRDKEALIDSSTKRYNTTQKTKKLDCPAHFTVYKVIWMPDYKLAGILSEKYEKKKASEIIKKKVENGESVGEEGFLYNLPNIEDTFESCN